MFEFLFSKKLTTLSFFDWVQRISVLLEEAKKSVHESNLEDTDENYLDHFRRSSQALAAAAGGIRLHVDIYGIYTNITDLGSTEKLYVVEFTRSLKVSGMPINQSFTKVSVSRHISNLVSARYNHLLGKVSSRINRLNTELWAAKSNASYLTGMVTKTSRASSEIQETPTNGSIWEEEIVNRLTPNTKPKARKKKPAAKKPAAKKPAAKPTKK